MTDITFLVKTKSPRRPERQPSLLIRNDHRNVSNKSHSNNYDSPATTTATTNRQRRRRTIPTTKQQQQPPSVVYIQRHHCEGGSVIVKCSSIDVFGSKNCGSSSLATTQSTHQQLQPDEECRRANSPRRPIRQPSCVIESPVQVFPTTNHHCNRKRGESSSSSTTSQRPVMHIEMKENATGRTNRTSLYC